MVEATEVYLGSPVRKNCFNGRVECAVGIGNCFFIFKIAYIANAAQYKLCAYFFAKVNGKSIVNSCFYFWLFFVDAFKPAHALLCRKHGRFGRVDANADNDFIKKRQCAVDDVGVAECYGVEGAGE